MWASGFFLSIAAVSTGDPNTSARVALIIGLVTGFLDWSYLSYREVGARE